MITPKSSFSLRSFLNGLAAASLILAVTNASAALIFEDTVVTSGTGAYVSGDNLQSQAPTTTIGFGTRAWGGANSAAEKPNGGNVAVTGIGGNSGSSLRWNVSSANNSRSNSRGFDSVSNQSTLWFGMTMSIRDANGLISGASGYGGTLSSGLVTTTATTSTGALWTTSNGGDNDGFAFGVQDGGLSVRYQTNAGGGVGTGSITTSAVASTFTLNTNYFLVSKLELNTNGLFDTLSIWKLTSAPTSESLLGTATFTITGVDIATTSADLDTLVIFGGSSVGSNSTQTLYDALRMGTDYGNVIPEPSAVALVVLGGVAVMIFRRKRIALKA